jgi:ribosomal protein S17
VDARKSIVNTKVLYAAGAGIAAVAVAMFFLLGSNLRLPGGQENATPIEAAELQVALKEIVVQKQDDRNASVQVIFTAYNPNRSTAVLETIHYTVHVGQFQMTSGDIGESPEGFLAGQPDTFPIVSNSTVTLRDTQVAERNNLTASSWDSMVDGTAQYTVDGEYSYRLTGANFQTSFTTKDFTVTFP